jgi:hypothetical protein
MLSSQLGLKSLEYGQPAASFSWALMTAGLYSSSGS